MEPSPRLETIDYVRQLGDHLESALFEARRVDDDPEAAIVLVKSALAYGELARARALVSRLERGAAAHPRATGLARAAATCRQLLNGGPEQLERKSGPRRAAAALPAPLRSSPATAAPFGPQPRRRSRDGRPTVGWESLTDTEARVAELVAQGLTNRQVARDAYMSRHTVDTHLRHIFRKLAVASRVQLARLVTERGFA
jgi:DNA-binding CsgD family transcriptional regulator